MTDTKVTKRIKHFRSYLAIAQDLVPFFAAEFTLAVILGRESIVPHQAIRRVLDTGAHHMVAAEIPKSLEGNAESCSHRKRLLQQKTKEWLRTSSASSTDTKTKHLHGHCALALAAVYASVACEDICPWLWCQRVGSCESHVDLCCGRKSIFSIYNPKRAKGENVKNVGTRVVGSRKAKASRC